MLKLRPMHTQSIEVVEKYHLLAAVSEQPSPYLKEGMLCHHLMVGPISIGVVSVTSNAYVRWSRRAKVWGAIANVHNTKYIVHCMKRNVK